MAYARAPQTCAPHAPVFKTPGLSMPARPPLLLSPCPSSFPCPTCTRSKPLSNPHLNSALTVRYRQCLSKRRSACMHTMAHTAPSRAARRCTNRGLAEPHTPHASYKSGPYPCDAHKACTSYSSSLAEARQEHTAPRKPPLGMPCKHSAAHILAMELFQYDFSPEDTATVMMC